MICSTFPCTNCAVTSRRGFTLLEMLIAMAVTLLMMAALARAFGFVGQRVRDSRADTGLSNELRDATTRLSDELKKCTVSLTPNEGEADQLGYFLYYEGPVTNATSSLFRAANDSSGKLILNDSRYGDFDDYLAFTAVASGDSWFTGKVPRYVLDQKTAQINGTGYSPSASAFEPVVVRSKYAEIIYFASPEYAPVTLPASPAYIDVDGELDLGSGSAIENGLPDRIRIHRRVLLIRPDLNLDDGMLPTQNSGSLDFMLADTWPTATTATANSTANLNDGWLYGMAGVHQQCDLSIRRVLNSSGLPTQRVAANSLSDLSKPHNRFAHVRVPNNVLVGSGSASSPTSMPVLALGGPATILNTLTGTPSPVRIAPPPTPNAGPVVTPSQLSGFLRPEFILGGNLTHIDDPSDAWGVERVGEDLLLNNALGFDIQIFDPNASFFRTASFPSSTTDLVVGPSDAGYREAVQAAILAVSSAPPPTPPAPAVTINDFREQGGFVDLAYPVLAGGAIRGWDARRLDRRSTVDNPAITTTGTVLITPFSGVANYSSGSGGATSRDAFQQALYESGRLVTTGDTVRLFQPAFDTYTSFYERDGFRQANTSGSVGTLWTTDTAMGATGVDAGTDGLDNDQLFGPDDAGERETLAPFRHAPEAVRISIRIENPATRQIRQFSVTHRDN